MLCRNLSAWAARWASWARCTTSAPFATATPAAPSSASPTALAATFLVCAELRALEDHVLIANRLSVLCRSVHCFKCTLTAEATLVLIECLLVECKTPT